MCRAPGVVTSTLFVNRRWIQSRRLGFAVEQAYQGFLMTGRHPIAVLNLKVPYEEVDVNVHPTKAEVRFREESAVFGSLQKAVRQSLLAASPVPVVRVTGWGEQAEVDSLAPQPSVPLLWQHAVDAEEQRKRGAMTVVATPPRQAVPPANALPLLRVIGQFGAVYIIAEGPDGMYLIDQHAAHERVLYDQFVARRAASEPEKQALLEPLVVDLTPRQRGILAQEAEALSGHGFEAEPFGEGAYVIRAVPGALSINEAADQVARFLDLMAEESPLADPDRVAMSLACHAAVRAGKTLSLDEMRDLVRQLEETATPNTCPHGRPTMVHMSADVLAREFGRR